MMLLTLWWINDLVTKKADGEGIDSRLLGWAVALGLGGLVAEAFRSFIQRRKMGADYADVIAGTAVKLLEPLQQRINDLQGQLTEVRAQLTETQEDLTATREQLADTQEELSHARQEAHDLREAMRGPA